MSVSDITVSGLAATPTPRGNKLTWSYSDPRSGALPNIALDMVEVWSSTSNDRDGTATKVGEGITDFLHAGLVEEQTYYYWIKARDNIGGIGAWYPTGNTSGVGATSLGVAGTAFSLLNGKIVPTIAGNALTISIKTAAGNDPSASDPIYVAFRNSSLGTGSYTTRQISAALSLVLPSGSTFGMVNNAQFRICVCLFDDAGTLRLAARNCSSASTVFPLPEFGIDSSTATSATVVNAGVFYTGTAVSSKPFRILGYLDFSSGLSTAGNYDVLPDAIELFGPGSHKPGDNLTTIVTAYGGRLTGTTLIPDDNTIPQSTEGDEYLNPAYTASSKINFILVEVVLQCSQSSGANPVIGAIFRDSETDAIGVGWDHLVAANARAVIDITAFGRAKSASAVTYRVRAGGTIAGTFELNGTGGGAKFNNTLLSKIKITEIKG